MNIVRKGNEAEVAVTLQIPGQEPMHIPGVLIKEGMTAKEIERAMIEVSKLVVAELIISGSMYYFSKVKVNARNYNPII